MRLVVVPAESQLTAEAHSSLHGFTYRAPLSGEILATVADGRFDLSEGVTARLEIDLELLKGDGPGLDGEMARRLDIRRYPVATAVIDSVVAVAGDVFSLAGTLTLHGRTRPLAGEATVTFDGGRMHATGSVVIDVRDFGIKPPSLLVVRVDPHATIRIDLVAATAGE
jgi:polyisoprenoid-binding protein YceI